VDKTRALPVTYRQAGNDPDSFSFFFLYVVYCKYDVKREKPFTFQMKLRQEKLDRTRFCRFRLVHSNKNWHQHVSGTSNVQK